MSSDGLVKKKKTQRQSVGKTQKEKVDIAEDGFDLLGYGPSTIPLRHSSISAIRKRLTRLIITPGREEYGQAL